MTGKRPTAAQSVADRVRANPFEYVTREEITELFGIGEDSIAKLVKDGAPTVAKKINPEHFKAWLWENRGRIGKLTE